MTDDYIIDYLAKHPTGYDPYCDAVNHPYEFLRGFRDAEAGNPGKYEANRSMAEANSYELGRFEYEEGYGRD